jgi:DNA (cytosine-5)-methyltransferase 1
MRVIDLFSGCGGLSLGFQKAGYEICAAFDNWEPAIRVYKKNFPDHPVFNCDLSRADLASEVAIFTEFAPQIIIGGPPCQDFSSAGKRDESLGRADLTGAFARILTAIRPEWFVMENVDRAVGSQAYADACKIFKASGYGLTQSILDASYCGVPQTRKRLFLIGGLGIEDNVLQPYLQKNLTLKPMTVREYFGDSLDVEHYYRHPRSYRRRGIFSIDEPSPTIRGVNRPVPAGYPGHTGDTTTVGPTLRPLTTKERSLIQTFPKEFIFEGTKADVEQMIGNAVPVKLAEYVAWCIQEYRENGPMATSKEELQQLTFQFLAEVVG